jgi:uncharacterized membrane protein
MSSIALRALALGVASGSRSSLGFSVPALVSRNAGPSRAATTLRALSVGGEFVIDKLPQTPSRLVAPGLVARFASGATGGFTLARRSGEAPILPVLAGMAGAAVGAWGGAAWRSKASARMPDWRGAVVEDAVALGLACGACRQA